MLYRERASSEIEETLSTSSSPPPLSLSLSNYGLICSCSRSFVRPFVLSLRSLLSVWQARLHAATASLAGWLPSSQLPGACERRLRRQAAARGGDLVTGHSLPHSTLLENRPAGRRLESGRASCPGGAGGGAVRQFAPTGNGPARRRSDARSGNTREMRAHFHPQLPSQEGRAREGGRKEGSWRECDFTVGRSGSKRRRRRRRP